MNIQSNETIIDRLTKFRFSISFLVSASFMNMGRTRSKIRGRAIISTMGLNRKSVT